MPICLICNKPFPNSIIIDGIRRNIHNRKYCLGCSPFGQHNTKQIHLVKANSIIPKYKLCPICQKNKLASEYYIRTNTMNLCTYCKECDKKKVLQKQRDIKLNLVQTKGNKCLLCGYDKCLDSLSFHHLDPLVKEYNISLKRKLADEIKSELDKCILVCSNCHAEIHAGLHLQYTTKDVRIHPRPITSTEKKLCTKCNTEKYDNDFYQYTNRKSYWCIDCTKQTASENYRAIKKWALEYKGGYCINCGYEKCNAALDFHHAGEKEFQISKYVKKERSTLKKELDRCVLLCRNCHREKHFELDNLVEEGGLGPPTF